MRRPAAAARFQSAYSQKLPITRHHSLKKLERGRNARACRFLFVLTVNGRGTEFEKGRSPAINFLGPDSDAEMVWGGGFSYSFPMPWRFCHTPGDNALYKPITIGRWREPA